MVPEGGIRIRALEAGDVDGILRLLNQPNVAAMTLQVPYQTRAEIEARITPGSSVRRLVAEHQGTIVGEAGLHLYSRRRQHVGAIGMTVGEEFQGRGVGTALLVALLDLADNWYALTRVELEVYVDNSRAIRLYEKHGFTIEGRHRNYAFRLGVLVDAYTMARIREPNATRDPLVIETPISLLTPTLDPVKEE